MAFPTIPTVAGGRIITTTEADTTSPRTSPNLSGLTKNAGDLLIAIVIAYQSTATANAVWSGWTAGWTEFCDSSTTSNVAIGAAYKWSDGTETGTIEAAQGATITGHACWIVMSIPGANASTPPEWGGRASVAGAASNAVADATSFNPTGWDVEDTLWIAVHGVGETATTGTFTGVTAAPAGWSGYAATGISADATGGIQGAVAFLQSAAASADPGTFTSDTSYARSGALVIAVRPVPVLSPPLETSSFGSFTGVNSGDTINSVDVAVNWFASSTTGMGNAVLQLWDGNSAQIGTDQSVALTTDSTHVDTFNFTGVTYAQLSTLRARVIAAASAAATGATVSVDYVAITVNYTPSGLSGSPADPVGVTDAATAVTTVARTVTDPVGVTDSATKVTTVARTANDPVGITDAVTAVLSVAVVDPVGVTDTATASLGAARTTADPAGITDTVGVIVTAETTVADAVGVTDSATADRVGADSASVNDPVGVTDSVTAAVDSLRAVADPVGVTDTPALAVTRTVTDPVGITDAATAVLVGFAPPLEVSNFGAFAGIGASDTIDGVDVKVNWFASSTTGLGNAVLQLWDADSAQIGADRTVALTTDSAHVDTFAFTGVSYAQLSTLRVRLIPHGGTAAAGTTASVDYVSITVTYTPAPGTDYSRAPADAVGVTDSATADKTGAGSATVNDAVGVTDQASVAIGRARTVADAVGVFDTGADQLLDIGMGVGDPVGVTDARTVVRTVTRTVVDPVGVTDAASDALAASRSVTDAVGVTDSAETTGANVIDRAPADPVGITDQAVATLAVSRTVGDSVGVTDQATRAAGSARTVADAVGVTDQRSVVRAVSRTVGDSVGVFDTGADQVLSIEWEQTDAVGVTDQRTIVRSVARTATDPVGVTDTATADRVGGGSASVSDPVGVTDSAPWTVSASRTRNDPVGVTDSATRAMSATRSRADTVGITDTVTVVLSRARTVADTVGITDTASVDFVGVGEVTKADQIGITDAVADVVSAARVRSDAVAVTDLVTATVAGSITSDLADQVAVADAATVVLTRSVGDPVGVTDTVTVVLARTVSISDQARVSDAVQRTVAYQLVLDDPVAITDLLRGRVVEGETPSLADVIVVPLASRWVTVPDPTDENCYTPDSPHQTLGATMRRILVSQGAAEMVGVKIVDPSAGADITGAVVRLSLGDAAAPGVDEVPDVDESTQLNVRKAWMLVSAPTPVGTYWSWVRIEDSGEVVLRRVEKVVLE